jgi:hypothetical protein
MLRVRPLHPARPVHPGDGLAQQRDRPAARPGAGVLERRKGLALAALLLALAACGPRPAPVAPPVEPAPLLYPAATRDRLLRILDGEWREWGSRIIDARRAPFADTEGPLAEQDPAAFSKVLAYWSAVGWQDYIERNKAAFNAGSAVGLCARDELDADGRDVIWGCEPWSAAFISFVMRSAGIDRAEFPPAPGHRTYVDALILAGARWPARATFLAHEVAEYAPAVGDLICADRAGRGRAISTLAERRGEIGAARPMHCDVVMAVAPGEVVAVGGNVAQGVTAVRYAADGRGLLVRNVRRWFVVFENRIGRGG